MYHWVDHTSELELRIEARSAEDAVAEATRAIGELLGDGAGESETRNVAVKARDPAGLLAAWLEELVFLSESEQLVPQDAHDFALATTSLEGAVEFQHGRPRHLVKAVTYHHLQLERSSEGWCATVVLDV